MSFDVYLQVFDKGEPAGIPRDSVRHAFGAAFVTEPAPDRWKVLYDAQNSCDVYLSADANPSLLKGLSVNRPCGDSCLWESLASILALGNVVLYFPDCRAPVVSHLSTTQHLPHDMIEALGNPVVVGTGAELLREIQAA